MKFSYPVVESIQSILPVCDRFIISVGNSEDSTLDLIRSIPSDKIEIFESVWDERDKRNGEVLSEETNKVFKRIPEDFDWAFYIQADEVLHEKYHTAVTGAMQEWLEHPRVEGLLFDYRHFYGSYDYNADSRSWYRKEIRIVRNDKHIRSYKDAQGFRIRSRKLMVKPVHATMYHYGWVRPPDIMQAKHVNFNKFYHKEEWVERNLNHTMLYDFSNVESITPFDGEHPAVMQERVRHQDWKVELDENKKRFRPADRVLYWIERRTGRRLFEYRNYKEI